MKQLFLLNIFFASLFQINGQNTWMQVDSMKGPAKCLATSFVIENTGYVVGGIDDVGCTRKMYSYNPAQNDWDAETSWGGELGSGQSRAGAVSFVLNNKAYVGLGQGEVVPYYNDMWNYDPSTGEWTQIADFIGDARTGAFGITNGNYGYVGLGQGLNGLLNDLFRYDAEANVWAPLADFTGTARKHAVAIPMGADIYVGTGEDGIDKNDFFKYSIVGNAWSAISSIPAAGRSGAVAWGTFPQLFVACGEDASGNYLNEVWEFNVFGNVWTQRTNFPGNGRKHATAFVINDKAYVGAGASLGAFYDDFYEYSATLSIDEKTAFDYTIFPNPSSEVICISSKKIIETVTVLEMNGKQVLLSQDSNVNVKELKNGSYQLQVEFRGENGEIISSRAQNFIKN